MHVNNEIYLNIMDVNSSYLLNHALYRTFFLLPRSISFYFFYSFMSYFNNYKKNNKTLYFYFFITVFLFFLVRYLFFFASGYSYIVIFYFSCFVNNFFFIFQDNYENKKALLQHVILNCFLNYEYIYKIYNKKIIFSEKEIIFNPKDFDFLKNFNNVEYLYKAFDIDKNIISSSCYYRNNHFYYSFHDYLNKKNSIYTNFTSNNILKVWLNDNNYKEVLLKQGWIPNIKNQFSFNYLTPVHILDESSKIKEIPSNFVFNMEKYKDSALKYIISSMNENLLYNDGKKFNDSLNLKIYDFMKKNNYNISEKMYYYELFISKNVEYLNTEQGLKSFELLICDVINN